MGYMSSSRRPSAYTLWIDARWSVCAVSNDRVSTAFPADSKLQITVSEVHLKAESSTVVIAIAVAGVIDSDGGPSTFSSFSPNAFSGSTSYSIEG